MPIKISPPLLNSASPWATTKEDLQALYECPFTGAVTTRTCTDSGFAHDEQIHQYGFFDSGMHIIKSTKKDPLLRGIDSINSLGYSPIPLSKTLDNILEIVSSSKVAPSEGVQKPFIISITGTAQEVSAMYLKIARFQDTNPIARLLVEINLSCPNIPGKPPPAYSREELTSYILACSTTQVSIISQGLKGVPDVGLKLPPFTYSAQFDYVIEALNAVNPCPVAFLTSTNTLGSALALDSHDQAIIKTGDETGIGGLAGQSIHPLSLGNVKLLRRRLDADKGLRKIDIIGVGGVVDQEGARRMRNVGACAVGVATALGIHGVGVFGLIAGNKAAAASLIGTTTASEFN